jgi:hypothetical protein
MKTSFIRKCLLVCCVVVAQLVSQHAQAQTASMTLDQLKAVKAIKIGNLEKDTYFKSGDFILDRYEERPAYVFNYSDGIPRKIYLYKIFTAADTKELGLLAVYENGKTKEIKPFVIPGASADRKAWDAYIDDLKYVGEKEAGLMSALGFVISREMSLLMGGGAKEEGGDKKKEEYNFCFPVDAVVTLADRQTKAIQDVKTGDEVLAYDAKTRLLVPAKVREATANHPVQTATGAQKLGDLRTGDVLYRFDGATRAVSAWKVATVQSNIRTVDKVYNLTTEKGSYLINDVVVLDK